MRKLILGTASHGFALAVGLALGFALGIFFLPILTAPESPDASVLEEVAANAVFKGELTRDLRGSDFLHWGEGTISISQTSISHEGKLAPGPDYKLYLVKQFVEHEDEFLPIKQNSRAIGDVKTFDGFLVDIPEGVNVSDYTTVLVWCEAFSEFITSVQYR